MTKNSKHLKRSQLEISIADIRRELAEAEASHGSKQAELKSISLDSVGGDVAAIAARRELRKQLAPIGDRILELQDALSEALGRLAAIEEQESGLQRGDGEAVEQFVSRARVQRTQLEARDGAWKRAEALTVERKAKAAELEEVLLRAGQLMAEVRRLGHQAHALAARWVSHDQANATSPVDELLATAIVAALHRAGELPTEFFGAGHSLGSVDNLHLFDQLREIVAHESMRLLAYRPESLPQPTGQTDPGEPDLSSLGTESNRQLRKTFGPAFGKAA